ncbi:transporter [Lysinibacillus sp. 2017]|nr:transporter [Lysinibacillus sp. 2017]TGN36380.1 transporter [Lysinibacillus sp. S2017]
MLSFLEKYGKQLLIPGSIGIAFLVYFFFIQDSPEQSSIETIDTISTFAATDPVPEIEQPLVDSSPQSIVVDVKGAVRYPGVYTLEDGQRIVDAIELAGGYIDQANPSIINHAQKLQDEMVIYIPKIGEEISETIEQLVQVPQTTTSSSGSSKSGKINLNQADENGLTQLPGVGPSKAKAIIQYRTEQGQFQVIEDLKKVTGIGEKTFEQLKDLIDVK